MVLGERKRQFSSDLVRSEKSVSNQWAKSGAILSISINLDLVAVIPDANALHICTETDHYDFVTAICGLKIVCSRFAL